MSKGTPKKHGEKITSARVFRANQGGFERRRHDRFLVTHQFFSLNLVTSIKDKQVAVEGWATDLSASGVGARVDSFLPRDTIVDIELVGEFEPGILKARVAWCNKLPTTGRIIKKKYFKWRMGLEFQFKSEDDKALIKNIIERM